MTVTNKNLFKSRIGLGAVCFVALLGLAAEGDYADERVGIANLPTGFVPVPKDLGGGNWVYVFDKPADNMVVTLRKDLVISRALVVGGGGSGGITYGGGGGGGGVWTNDVPIDVVSGATVSIMVGAGGAKVNGGEKTTDNSKWALRGNNGGTSQFVVGGKTYAAVGGGGGGSFSMTAGLDGANGGGGSYNGAGGQATMEGGHKGAPSVGTTGGGGGGAGADANGALGGEGVANDITGVSQVYGSGGGGSSPNGVGGTNAGAGNSTDFGSDAIDGFGGGGGGGGYTGYAFPGGKGGDGTVILVLYDPPDPELPGAHVSAETSGIYSHTVEVTVDKLGEGASAAKVSLAYGLAGGALGDYQTVAENVTAGATIPCAMTVLPVGSYQYAVKVINDLGKEKTIEGKFQVAEVDYTDERVYVQNLPSGFVLAPKDLGDGAWAYVFDRSASNMVITLRKDLVINHALVVGGGGAGGSGGGGGGGGGGVWTNDEPIDAVLGATVSVTVGAGGAVLGNEADVRNENGGVSMLTIGAKTYQVLGGGAGASYNARNGWNGANGGGGIRSGGEGGEPADGTGHAGGQGCALWGLSAYDWIGGGGGGAGAPGQAGNPGISPNRGKSGDGGEGISSDITGTSVVYGSGGGAGNGSDAWVDSGKGGTNAGDGGVGSDGMPGTPGTGGGGGGGCSGYSGGKGGDGTVILVLCDPPDPELPGAHVKSETPGDHSHTVEVTVDKLGEGASSAKVSIAYGPVDGSLGAYRTVAENVAAGATVSCAMTELPSGSYRYAVKVVNDLGKEKVIEGQFLVIDLPPADATGDLIGLKGDVLVIDLEPNAQGNFVCRSYKDVDMGAFNCDVYKTSKMVLRLIPAREEGYPCRPQWVARGTSLQPTDVKVVSSNYYFSVFPITRAQFTRVTNPNAALPLNPLHADVDHNYNTIRCNDTLENIAGLEIKQDPGHWINRDYKDPTDKVTPDSFMGILGAKCVNEDGQAIGEFDLPTELQWEIAARADSFAANGSFWDKTQQKVVDGLAGNASLYTPLNAEPQSVGTLAPNAWGIYDTQGAWWEMCLDVFTPEPSTVVEEAAIGPGFADGYSRDPTYGDTYGGERVIHGYQAGNGSLDYYHPSLRSFWRATDPTRTSAQGPGAVTYRVRLYHEDLPPQKKPTLWITDHADAGAGKVHLAFQPIFAKPVDMATWIPYARENGLIHYVAADTEAALANAPLKDDFTFRGGDGMKDVAKGWCWITVPATNKLYKIVICGEKKLGGVQLWENGPYFAECNVGATKPEESGYYFWWGDTNGYVKAGANWKNARTGETGYKFADGNCPTFQKSEQDLLDGNWIDGNGNLTAENDAATSYLGSAWRMPTAEDLESLLENCTWTWTSNWNDTGVSGYVITGNTTGYTDKSIFLPATGYADGNERVTGSAHLYWSSTRKEGNVAGAANLRFLDTGYVATSTQARWYGLCVRPVRNADK